MFVSLDELDPALGVLRQAGCVFEPEAARASAAARGDFAVRCRGMRVDVFIPSIPLYDSARQRVRIGPLRGRPARYLAPEDLALFKLLFFRTKDILDVERLVAFGGASFDRDYVRAWLVKMMGEQEDRVSRWDRLVREVSFPVPLP